MEFTASIRQVVMRGRGAAALDANASRHLWAGLLDGALDETEVAAVVAAYAVCAESGEELIGAFGATQSRLARWTPPGEVVTIPAYGWFPGEAAMVALIAVLLRHLELRVAVHGVLDSPCGVSCARVLRELGVMPSASLAQATHDLAQQSMAFLPVQLLSPALARVLALRSRLGVDTLAHRVAQALDPAHGSTMRIVPNAESLGGRAMPALIESLEGNVLSLTWSGARPPSTLALRPRIARMRSGIEEVLFEADAHEISAALPLPEDAIGVAALVSAIATGRAPVPAPALNLLAACLYATGRAPDLARAKAAAAVAGCRLAA